MFRLFLLLSLVSSCALGAEPIVVEGGAQQTAVLELYTSEGCSSCPRADRWMSQLVAATPGELDVLALGFHVDYWNYLGWNDRFSSPAYTKRQRELGANNRQRTIYTPEFFVNGREARGTGNVIDMIEQVNRQAAPLALRMEVDRDDGELVVTLQAPAERNQISAQVHHRYLIYENNLSTDVKRGENSGETLHHQQVVRYMSRALKLQPDNRHRIPIDPEWRAENIGVAVLVTSPGDRDYLQALHTPVAPLLRAD